MCIENSRFADAAQDLAISVLSIVKRQLQETRNLLDDPQFVAAAGKIDQISINAERVGVHLTIDQWSEQRRVLMIKEQKSAKARRAIDALAASIDESISLMEKGRSVSTPQFAAAKSVQSRVETLRTLFATEAGVYAVWHARTNSAVVSALAIILDELSELLGKAAVFPASTSTPA